MVQVQARFFEKAQLEGVDMDPDTRGVFCRDPEMDAFIISGPAVAAGLKIQAGFEELHGKEDCLRKIQHYTKGGGDQGAGDRFMSKCCGLKPLAEPSMLEAQAGEAVVGGIHLGLAGAACEGTEVKVAADDSRVCNLSLACISFMQAKGLDALTPSYLAQVNFSTMGQIDARYIKRTDVWKAFLTSPLWRLMSAVGKATESLYPRIQTNKPFGVLFSPADKLGLPDEQLASFATIPANQLTTTLTERYDLEPLLAWQVNDDLNKSNSSLLISTLLTEAKRFKTKKLKSWQP